MRDVLAAKQALQALSRVTGRFSQILSAADRLSVTVDGVLRRNPKSKGNLHWASDSGRYRNVWVVGGRADQERLFRVYFGRWRQGPRGSAYVVIFRYGKPILEVRLSMRRPSEGYTVPVAHDLVFRGRRYEDPKRLRDSALARVRRAGVRVQNRRAILGEFDINNGRLRPTPHEFLRRILICALIKQSLVEKVLRESGSHKKGRITSDSLIPKRERFPKGQRAKIDVLLDGRFEAQGRHNALLNRIGEHLNSHGYQTTGSEEPFDLVVRGKGRTVIVEAKAWADIVGALRAATGQLLYYSHLYARRNGKKPQLVAAIPFVPRPELIDFVEGTAGVGLVWSTGGRRFEGGRLAGRLLPELLSKS